MSPVLIRILQLLLSLSFLVMIHELGHFVFARLNGVRVSKFYMFFNPQISLFRMKKIRGKWQFKFFAPNVKEDQKVALNAAGEPLLWEDDADEKTRKKFAKKEALSDDDWAEIERDFNFGRTLPKHQGHPKFTALTDADRELLDDDDWRKYPETTEWGIGWLPLGGYCAICGMVDETTSADQLGSEPQPWEYRSKKTWQRLPIICGGVLVNLIGAFVIYSAILFHWGSDVLPLDNATYGMQYSNELLAEGFRHGDRIIEVAGKKPETIKDLLNWMVIDGEHDVVALRQNMKTQAWDTVRITLADNFDRRVLAANSPFFIEFRFPFVIGDIQPDGPAAKALLMVGDSIIAIGNVPTPYFQDVSKELEAYACDSVYVTYVRSGVVDTARLFLGDEAKMFVHAYGAERYIAPRHVDYSFWQSIPAGVRFGWETLVNYVKQFRLVFTPEGAKSLGGFAAIGSLFPGMWNWHAFWLMTAFLSVILAFMNIIPIPGLDGGHVFFLLWEMITGKKPSDKFLEIANNIGFYLLLALLIFANGNDLFKWLTKFFE